MGAGKNWHKEVSTWKGERQSPPSVKYEQRINFYKDRVKFKLKKEFDDVINNLSAQGYATFNEHKGKNLDYKIKSGDTLFVVLKDFYKSKFGFDTSRAEKEAYLSLAHIMKEATYVAPDDLPGNIDDLKTGGSITIEDGLITVKDAKGHTTLNQEKMRPVDTTTTEEPGESLTEDEEIGETLLDENGEPLQTLEDPFVPYKPITKIPEIDQTDMPEDFDENGNRIKESTDDNAILETIPEIDQVSLQEDELPIVEDSYPAPHPVITETIEAEKEKITKQIDEVKAKLEANEVNGVSYEVAEDGKSIKISKGNSEIVINKTSDGKWDNVENEATESLEEGLAIAATVVYFEDKVSGIEGAPFINEDPYSYSIRGDNDFRIFYNEDEYFRFSKPEIKVPSFIPYHNALAITRILGKRYQAKQSAAPSTTAEEPQVEDESRGSVVETPSDEEINNLEGSNETKERLKEFKKSFESITEFDTSGITFEIGERNQVILTKDGISLSVWPISNENNQTTISRGEVYLTETSYMYAIETAAYSLYILNKVKNIPAHGWKPFYRPEDKTQMPEYKIAFDAKKTGLIPNSDIEFDAKFIGDGSIDSAVKILDELFYDEVFLKKIIEGKLIYPDERKYDGQYKVDGWNAEKKTHLFHPHGKGVMTQEGEYEIEGEWKEGNLVSGKKTMESGEVYNFVNGEWVKVTDEDEPQIEALPDISKALEFTKNDLKLKETVDSVKVLPWKRPENLKDQVGFETGYTFFYRDGILIIPQNLDKTSIYYYDSSVSDKYIRLNPELSVDKNIDYFESSKQ